MAEWYESLHEELIQMEKAHVVRSEDAGDESGDVGLADDFLLVGLEHLDCDRIDEGGLAAVDLACLVEEVLERAVGLALFSIIIAHEVLDVRETSSGDGMDELSSLSS